MAQKNNLPDWLKDAPPLDPAPKKGYKWDPRGLIGMSPLIAWLLIRFLYVSAIGIMPTMLGVIGSVIAAMLTMILFYFLYRKRD